MATASLIQYNSFAQQYNSISDLPHSHLEKELITAALGDCTGLKVLDIGGGSGLHARKAVEAGAEVVDLIDVSPAMIEIGKSVEAGLGREGRIRWHVGDATGSFDELPLEKGGYDIVLVGWTFDHATREEELETMWANVSKNCKKGGKLVNIRVNDYKANHVDLERSGGKYGVFFTGHEEIPGGVRYMVNYCTTPPFSHEGTSMKESFSLSNKIGLRHGFSNLSVVPVNDMAVVKKDPEFWEKFVESGNFAVVTADKL